MVTVGAVRVTTLVICVGGIIGMIVTSILNHNGAAVTFGLITAVAILCSMVAKAVATSTEQRLGASPQRPAVTGDEPQGDLAEEVERQVVAVVGAGADEATVRHLVGDAVRLGRALAGGARMPRRARH